MDFAIIVLCYHERDRAWANQLRDGFEYLGGKNIEVLMNSAAPGRNFKATLERTPEWATVAVVVLSKNFPGQDLRDLVRSTKLHAESRSQLRVFGIVVDDSSWENFEGLEGAKILNSFDITGSAQRVLDAIFLTHWVYDPSYQNLKPPQDLNVLLAMSRSKLRDALVFLLEDKHGVGVRVADDPDEALERAHMSDVGAIGADISIVGSPAEIESLTRLKRLYPHKELFIATSFRPSRYLLSRLGEQGYDGGRWFTPSDGSFNARDLKHHVASSLDKYAKWLETFTSRVELSPVDMEIYRAIERHPEILKTLDWRRFEELLADLLVKLEYKVELMSGTKDNGVDIIAIRKEDVFGLHKYLIQAKRWKNKVGVEPVQQLLFQRSDRRATKACLATTSSFTRGARDLAREYEWQLELRDYTGLRDWIRQALGMKI